MCADRGSIIDGADRCLATGGSSGVLVVDEEWKGLNSCEIKVWLQVK